MTVAGSLCEGSVALVLYSVKHGLILHQVYDGLAPCAVFTLITQVAPFPYTHQLHNMIRFDPVTLKLANVPLKVTVITCLPRINDIFSLTVTLSLGKWM